MLTCVQLLIFMADNFIALGQYNDVGVKIINEHHI